MHVDVVIIGGGLSGLHAAYQCQKRHIQYALLEARNRFGGRILSFNGSNVYQADLAAFDLGPSWFWPEQQRMHALLKELGMDNEKFFHNSQGVGVYEDAHGYVQRGVDGISMSGAYRLKGGIRQLIKKLHESLSSDNVLCNAAVCNIKYCSDKLTTTYVVNNVENQLVSNHVILTLPPRVALAHIHFEPCFSEERKKQLLDIATWMAGHAKLVCVYDQPFWRQQGMSGDVISHRGPLQEIHDASYEAGSLYALFGFVGVPPAHRRNRQEELKKMSVEQLGRLFGEQALNPVAVYLQDWAQEQYTSTELDQELQRFHPLNNIGDINEPSWNHRLIWSGSEAADYRGSNNGFLEGALEASMQAVNLVE